MKKRTMLIVVLVFFTGCLHNRQFSNYNEINSITEGRLVSILLSDGSTFKGNGLHIEPDSTRWINKNDSSKQVVSTSKVEELSFVNRVRGAWHGFRTFLLTGAGLGLLTLVSGDGTDTSDDSDSWISLNFPTEFWATMWLVAGVEYGVLLGIPLGATIGSKDKFVLSGRPVSYDPIIEPPQEEVIQIDIKKADTTSGKIIVVSDLVGEVIDLEERNRYNIFLGTKGFQTAVLLQLPDRKYAFKITYIDEKTGEEKIKLLHQIEADIVRLKEHIEKK